MLRNGSDGARRSDDAGALGAADGAVDTSADGPADYISPNAVGRALPDPPESLVMPRLSAGALAGLEQGELLSLLGDIERLANRLAGYRTEVLDALDALNQSGAAPDASPHLSLRDAARVSERDARRMVRAAEKAREHGAVLEALSGGDINAVQAEMLCDARVPDPVRAELVAAAAGEDTDATRRRVQCAEAEHSVETSMERFERQRKARGAGWRRDHEGMLRLWAKFDPDAGAHVEAALAALCREYWIDDKQVRSGRRTPAQRDADVLSYALAGLTYTDADAAAVRRLHARASARSDNLPDEARDPSRQLPPAQISVLIGLDALRGHTDEMGLTDAGVELPPEVVRRLACDAEIIPMILGGSGGSADAGRCRRTVSLRLRRLLVARDRHCRWPGCHEPPSRCDAHHIWHWLDGGPTNLDNLVLLCRRHHHFLHQHGYRMVPQPDGTWLAVQESDARPTTTPRRAQRQARAP
ncbi:MAG: DUF222 domain-containing protein [Acidimicrobiales bacterium]|nr:DUF222 domain-containing protein [Acidimicrobiales bacterium]MYD82171.1 DUF222 domain-containing protein [Acidimicrobiales bacterium]MYJ64224.1 DUF222 domain-containing protein [Acidimicrobiales bacterium]